MLNWFSKRKSSRPARLRRKLVAETLEARQMLAGDVVSCTAPSDNTLMGDQNYDGVVDSTDLGLLLNNYRANEGVTWEHGDFNADTVVDSTDLGLLLNNFNKDTATASQGQDEVDPSEPPSPADDHANEIGDDATPIDFISDNGLSFGDLFGELEVAGDIDVFQFTSEIDQPFSASMFPFHFGGSSQIELLDADGVVVVSMRSDEPFVPVDLNADLTAGLYYVRVSSLEATGGYSAQIQMGTWTPPVVVDDHVDEIGPDATIIDFTPRDGAFFGDLFGEFEVAGDIDVFQFTSEIDQPFSASMFPFHFDGSSQIELLDADGSLVASAQADEPFAPADLNAELTAGLYYVRVSSLEATGGYSTQIQMGIWVPPVIVDDHANEVGPDATQIVFEGEGNFRHAFLEGELHVPEDIDVFQINVSDTAILQTLLIPLTPIVMEVLDEGGQVLAEASSDAGFFQTELEEGVYFLAFRTASDGVTGPYLADIELRYDSVIPPPPATDDHADEIGPDATVIPFEASNGAAFGHAAGVLGTTDDVDVFQFATQSDQPLFLNFYPDIFTSASLEVVDSDGVVLVSQTSTGLAPNLEIQVDLEEGQYYLRVAAGDDSAFSIGHYHMEIQLGTPDISDDHANEIGDQATQLVLNSPTTPMNGAFETAGDVDVFQFTAESELALHIHILSLTGGTTSMELISAETQEVVASAEGASVGVVEFDVDVLPGTYYVRISGDATGPYIGSVSLPAAVVDDHGDEIGEATEIELFDFDGSGSLLLGSAFGILESDGDVDVFQFTTEEDAPLNGEVITFSGSPIVVDLLDQDGDLILSISTEEFGLIGLDESLPAGTYYFAVYGASDDNAGEYFVDFQVGEFVPPPPPADDHVDEIGADATLLPFDEFDGALFGFTSGQIGTDDDVDVFQFTTETDQPFSAVAHVEWFGSINLELLDSDGVVIASAIYEPGFAQNPLETDFAAGSYFLRVTSDSPAAPNDPHDGPFGGPFVEDRFYHIELQLGETTPPVVVDDHADEIGADATELIFNMNPNGFDAPFDGVLETDGDVDVFQFTLDTASPLMGTFLALGESETRIELISRETGEVVLTVEGGGDFTPLDFEAVVSAGTYYLRVSDPGGESRPYFGTLTGRLDAHVDTIGAESTIITLSPDRGTFVGVGNGFLESETDVDVFQFQLADTQPVEISLNFSAPGTMLTLSNADGTVVDTLDSVDAAIINSELTHGTYYVSVSGGEIGSFSFSLRVGTVDLDFDDHADEFGPDATEILFHGGANPFYLGGSNLEASEDVDVFQFQIDSLTQFNLLDLSSNRKNIELLAEDGTMLNPGPTEVSLELEAGLYYIRVSAADTGESGEFLFILQGITLDPINDGDE